MKRLIIILFLISSSLFGQNNPMFDSVDYFLRNKIKTVHEYHSSWYYGGIISYFKTSFDKQTRTLRYDSLGFNPADSLFAKDFMGFVRNFRLRDTIYPRSNGYNDTIKYIFDSKKRLYKRIYASTAPKNVGRIGIKGSLGGERVPHVTTTTYFYTDTISKKISQEITESPYFIDKRNFYYTKTFLSTRTSVDSNKLSNRINFESMVYDYYPDKKLKKQTRRVSTDHCPGICEGTIEYKYDTEFKNDSTPSGIKPIPYIKLITIENKSKSEICIELYGYPDNSIPRNKAGCFHSRLRTDSVYEIIFDPRTDHNTIYERKKNISPAYERTKYSGFEIFVYTKPDKLVFYESTPRDTLFFEKCKTESLFKKPKIIVIKEK